MAKLESNTNTLQMLVLKLSAAYEKYLHVRKTLDQLDAGIHVDPNQFSISLKLNENVIDLPGAIDVEALSDHLAVAVNVLSIEIENLFRAIQTIASESVAMCEEARAASEMVVTPATPPVQTVSTVQQLPTQQPPVQTGTGQPIPVVRLPPAQPPGRLPPSQPGDQRDRRWQMPPAQPLTPGGQQFVTTPADFGKPAIQ